MERFVISGGKKLRGTTRVSGAKNAVLKLMPAALLANNKCFIENVPRIRDVNIMIGVLQSLGATITWCGDNTLCISTGELSCEPPDRLVKEMRASVQVMGPLLAKTGKVKLFQPGGCVIGPRPINFHLKAFENMGARVVEEHGYVKVEAKKLHGAEIHLDFPSVGATENIMAAATTAEGATVIRNAAKEPEIIEQQNFYNQLGARIRGAGTDTIKIEGVEKLNSKEISYGVIPDRIETGTLMVAAAITGGDIWLEDVIPEHNEAIIAKLREINVGVDVIDDRIHVYAKGPLRATNVTVLPYPGFPTDLQPQITALLSTAEGTSVISENVFENRFAYIAELLRMGADIRVEGRTAIIRGVPRFSSATVEATDLRAGAALLLAALAAEGTTYLEKLKYLDRGYEKIEAKFGQLGADIKREQMAVTSENGYN
ncbi:MAG: UDP-N-acetylglucosamine 1-carboxyvinyltransferase [Bacillota bacterium]